MLPVTAERVKRETHSAYTVAEKTVKTLGPTANRLWLYRLAHKWLRYTLAAIGRNKNGPCTANTWLFYTGYARITMLLIINSAATQDARRLTNTFDWCHTRDQSVNRYFLRLQAEKNLILKIRAPYSCDSIPICPRAMPPHFSAFAANMPAY